MQRLNHEFEFPKRVRFLLGVCPYSFGDRLPPDVDASVTRDFAAENWIGSRTAVPDSREPSAGVCGVRGNAAGPLLRAGVALAMLLLGIVAT